MFAVDCPTHGSRVILPVTRIRAIANTDTGILVQVECWCGTHIRLRTGRLPGVPAHAAAAAGPGSGFGDTHGSNL